MFKEVKIRRRRAGGGGGGSLPKLGGPSNSVPHSLHDVELLVLGSCLVLAASFPPRIEDPCRKPLDETHLPAQFMRGDMMSIIVGQVKQIASNLRQTC
jgi:hypothetical protein